MKTAWLILVFASVLSESCNGATVKGALQRRKREFVIPPNLDKILEEQKDEIPPGLLKVLSLLSKNATEEEFFAALLTIDPSQLESSSTRPEMAEGSGNIHMVSDDEDLEEGSGGGHLDGQTPITPFSGSPGFGPTEEPLGSTPSADLLVLHLQEQVGGPLLSPEIIIQLLQTQSQEDNNPNPEMLTLLLHQVQQIAQGQDGNSSDFEFPPLLFRGQEGSEGGVPSPEMLSFLLRQHGQQVGQEGTPSPEFLTMILKLEQDGPKPNATIPFPVASGENTSGKKQEFATTCNPFERKAAESVLLCEEIARPVYEKCFNGAGLVVTLPFVSSSADFADSRPVQTVLILLEKTMEVYRYGDFENQISEFDRTVQEADIENNGSIKACMQQSMKEDIYAECNASSNFKCYMESCVENKSRSA